MSLWLVFSARIRVVVVLVGIIGTITDAILLTCQSHGKRVVVQTQST